MQSSAKQSRVIPVQHERVPPTQQQQWQHHDPRRMPQPQTQYQHARMPLPGFYPPQGGQYQYQQQQQRHPTATTTQRPTQVRSPKNSITIPVQHVGQSQQEIFREPEPVAVFLEQPEPDVTPEIRDSPKSSTPTPPPPSPSIPLPCFPDLVAKQATEPIDFNQPISDPGSPIPLPYERDDSFCGLGEGDTKEDATVGRPEVPSMSGEDVLPEGEANVPKVMDAEHSFDQVLTRHGFDLELLMTSLPYTCVYYISLLRHQPRLPPRINL